MLELSRAIYSAQPTAPRSLFTGIFYPLHSPCSPTIVCHVASRARSHLSPFRPVKCLIDSLQAPELLSVVAALISRQRDYAGSDSPSSHSVSR